MHRRRRHARSIEVSLQKAKEATMHQRIILRICGLAVGGFLALSGAVAQTAQKPAKDLIVGNWTLMIADDVRADGTQAPGFGPLPSGTAKFSPDGRYSVEIKRSSPGQGGVSYSGSYTLDEAGTTLTLHVDESAPPDWRGSTQTGKVDFLTGDYL